MKNPSVTRKTLFPSNSQAAAKAVMRAELNLHLAQLRHFPQSWNAEKTAAEVAKREAQLADALAKATPEAIQRERDRIAKIHFPNG